jgi:hypothetical protein
LRRCAKVQDYAVALAAESTAAEVGRMFTL